MIDCFLYSGERQTLFNLVEHYIPNFNQLNKAKKYEVLVNGIHADNPDYNATNTTISISVQNFIFKTKRFYQRTPFPSLIVKCFLNCCLTFVHSFFYSNFIYNPVTYLSSHIQLYIHAKFTREKTQDKTIWVFWSHPWTNCKIYGQWLICTYILLL